MYRNMDMNTSSMLSESQMEGSQGGSEKSSFIFSVALKAGSRTEYTFDPAACLTKYHEFKDRAETYLRHTLKLDYAICGPQVKKDEVNIVEVEIDALGQTEKVSFPLVSLREGNGFQAPIYAQFPDCPTASKILKFTLAEGTGPVHLVGNHIIEEFFFQTGESDSEGQSMEEDEDIEEEELADLLKGEQPGDAKKVIKAKRRMNENGNGPSTSADAGIAPKKPKVEETNGTTNGKSADAK